MKATTIVVCVVALLFRTNVHSFHTCKTFQDRSYRLFSVVQTEAAADAQPETSSIVTIPPGGRFRDCEPGELSIVSFNLLAPSYHLLAESISNSTTIEYDRRNRVPMSIDFAKQANADILCLQEVEGGPEEDSVREMLASPIDANTPGYDSLHWSALHPNRKGDIVGICVAWRSNRHAMVSADCFRRGMVVQMQEIESGATFCIGNVHLPAKPSAIEGRLKAISTTIKSIQGCESPLRQTPLDGLAIVCGDFNCDHKSVTTKLLTRGSTPYGTIRDRNYKAKISKNAAFGMQHAYRFQDVYAGDVRENFAPVTVSLTGRGPGCMDQMLFTSRSAQPSMRKTLTKSVRHTSKRKARREAAVIRTLAEKSDSSVQLPMQVLAILATVDLKDEERRNTIDSGLPNVEQGFPSDHIPIGAIFGPDLRTSLSEVDDTSSIPMELPETHSSRQRGGAISANTKRRRETFERSLASRRRHNAILRTVTEWIESRGATTLIRDVSINRWPWFEGVRNYRNKLRAPDLCCVINNELIIVEVTVASNNPSEIRRQKLKKYQDLKDLLSQAPRVVEAGLTVHNVHVVVVDEKGGIPEETRKDLADLARLSSQQEEDYTLKTNLLCNKLEGLVLNTR